MANTRAARRRTPKAARRAAATGTAPVVNLNLSSGTLHLAHEALVQMRKPNSQVTIAVAQAMAEIENLIAAFGAQQEVAAAAAAEAPTDEAKGKDK